MILDRVAVSPDGRAVVGDHIALTWKEVGDILKRAVHQLRKDPARTGVAVWAANGPETLLSQAAASLAGASVVPINFHLLPAEAVSIISRSGADLILCDHARSEVAAAYGAERAIPVVVWGADGELPAGARRWEDWLAESAAEDIDVTIESRPYIMFTSGTSGIPKMVKITNQFGLPGTVQDYLAACEALPFTKGSHLVVGPLYHTGPISGVRALLAGQKVVVPSRFDAEGTLALIHDEQISSTVMVPTHFSRLLALSDETRGKYTLSSIDYVAHTGAACPAATKRGMIEWWGPVLVEAYGATESGTICRIDSNEWLTRPGSVGRAMGAFVRAFAASSEGVELPSGVPGHLYFEDSRGLGIVYDDDPEKTSRAHLRPGVFTLGDIGYVDEEGYIFITDRGSDMIISGGVNIYPAEAENVLSSHPEVHDVIVVAVPDKDLGEVAGAVVVLHEDSSATESELIAFCRGQLSTYKCPRAVVLVDELPRTAMGKVNKNGLGELYWPSGIPI